MVVCLICEGSVSAQDASAPPAVALTLPEAVERALRDNRELRRLAAEHEAALIAVGTAAAEFDLRLRPEAGVSSSAAGQSRQVGLALLRKTEWGAQVELAARAAQSERDGPDEHRRAVRFSISQPLFRYAGREVNREPIARAEAAVRAAVRRLELAKSDLALRVAQTYYDLFRAEEQARLEETSLARLDALHRLVELRSRQGQASTPDVLRVAAQRGEAETRRRAARALAERRRLELAELIGVQPGAAIAVAPPPFGAAEAPPLTDAIAAARANRLDLAQYDDDAAEALRGARVARQLARPGLRVVAAVEQSGVGETWSEGGRSDTQWIIGLQADGDWGGRQQRLAARRAELDALMVQEDRERAVLTIERQVREQHLALENAIAELAPARLRRETAEARLRLARRLFEMGRADAFGVSDAEREFQQAETAELSARIEAMLAELRLRRAVGVLLETPDELKPRTAPSP